MAVDGWALWSVAIKFLGLLAMAGVVGGSFVHLLADRLQFPQFPQLRCYLLASGALGLLMTPFAFLLQVGGINHNGMSGMFDGGISVILLSSTLGEVLGLRLSAFALFLAAIWFLADATSRRYRHETGYLLCALSALLLCVSFAFTGHTTELFMAAKMLLVLHVLAALLWTGALYPLWYLSGTAELVKVQKLMRGFGVLAVCMVVALVLAGIFLASQLLQNPGDLLTTSYGITFMLKLGGVVVLLLLAALNKLRFVPRLQEEGVGSLQRSIRFEIAVALYVLAMTSWLTTATGPVGA